MAKELKGKRVVRKIWSEIKRILVKGGNSFPRKIMLSHANGEKICFVIHSSTEDYRISKYGDEKDFLDRFISELKEDDIVFDIGASVGLMTVHAALIVKKGKVIAFEPDTKTRACLKKNVTLNKLLNVDIVPWAVSDVKGSAVLFSDGPSGCAPTLREQKCRSSAPKGKIVIETEVLDDAIASGKVPLPTVLKIDIEGAEILCIKGSSKLLNGELGPAPRKIFLEMHPEFLPDFGATAQEVHQLICGAGYSDAWQFQRDAQVHCCYEKI